MDRGVSLYQEHAPLTKKNRASAKWWKFYSVYKYDFELYHQLKCDVIDKPHLLYCVLFLDTIPACVYLFYYLTIQALTKYDEEKIRKMCFILDDEGQKQHLGDQRHIYRIKTLKKLREALVPYLDLLTLMSFQQDLNTEIVRDFGDYTYYEERYTTATYLYGYSWFKGQKFTTQEIQLNWVSDEDIRTQIKTYISVLRLCKKGTSLDKAVKTVKERKNNV